MDAAGDFVITWTSFGQGNDNATQSNVYAKRFASSTLNWNPDNITAGGQGWGNLPGGSGDPYVTTIDNPDQHIVATNAGYSSVVEVYVDDFGSQGTGSGSLLAGTDWILTAGHVAWSDTISAPLLPQDLSVAFDTAAGPGHRAGHAGRRQPGLSTVTFRTGTTWPCLSWRLCQPASRDFPSTLAPNEVGKVFTLMGYGTYGTGAIGAVFDPDDQKREGENVFDTTGTTVGFTDTTVGGRLRRRHHAGRRVRGLSTASTTRIRPLWLPKQEAMAAPGDSGGPGLINGMIAGVVSGSGGHGAPTSIPGYPGQLFLRPDRRLTPAFPLLPTGSTTSPVSTRPGEFLVNQNDVINISQDATWQPGYRQLGNPFTSPSTTRAETRPLLGGHGRRRRFRHHLDQLRPRRRGQRLRRRRQRRERRLCPPLQRQCHSGQRRVPSEPDRPGQPAERQGVDGRRRRFHGHLGEQPERQLRRLRPPLRPHQPGAIRPELPSDPNGVRSCGTARIRCTSPIPCSSRRSWSPTPISRSQYAWLRKPHGQQRRDRRRNAGQHHDRRRPAISPAWPWTPPATPWSSGAATGRCRASRIRKASSTNASLGRRTPPARPSPTC